ncbi:type 2 lanthipeptide synthetase LanM family protein [Cyanobacterium aponinum AL20118]|uniref:Type 2 lanthipeptide synthetase LanM family protein n=1 Tax=Cyanobacterium aponinum AL20115 TaxID=3090662 RepID=A0AAF0ZBG0_9CHRO|nr:type 2 lanthipeptide synthetase LanM family protein [Cyanobacterium aponinum]WPF89941.1 type 2 lanthipeptide synthetase LanM family protein [Cyanobacterium aponinum AL20115]
MKLENHHLETTLSFIQNQASSINERLTYHWIPNISNSCQSQVEENLTLWCHIVAKGNKEKFKQRLAFEGFTLDKISLILAEGNFSPDTPLPEWLITLKKVIQKAENLELSQLPENIVNSTKIPFEPIYTPFIQVAWDKLRQRTKSNLDLLNNDSLVVLEQQLINQLAYLCTSVLLEEFKNFRSSGNEMKEFILTQIKESKSNNKYKQFLDNLLSDNLISFFEKYSVLGKLSAILINYWVEANQEFITRLNNDLPEIERLFSSDKPLKQVIDIQVGLSDSHERGRSVIALKFDTGLKLIYKPRNIHLDVNFYQFLNWFNQKSNLIPLKTIKIIHRDNYGWIEFLSSLPCNSEQEAKNFYYRYGMLVCLTYTLEGSDFHFENLISHGDNPMLIDLEGLLQPRTKANNDDNGISLTEGAESSILKGSTAQHASTASVGKLIQESVFRTFLIPIEYSFLNDDVNVNVGGLAVEEEKKIQQIVINNINSDAMNLGLKEVVFTQRNNLPVLNNAILSPKDYLEDIVQGFKETYEFLLKKKKLLLSEESPFLLLKNQNTRYLFRNTNTYNTILSNSYHPSLLKSGIKRSIALDVLSRAFLGMKNPEKLLPILRTELREMEDLDIPCFTSNTSINGVYVGKGEMVADMFEKPSFESLMTRFENFSHKDLEQQVQMIRSAFYAQLVKQPQPISLISTDDYSQKQNLSLSDSTSLNQELLFRQVVKIAEDLEKNAVALTTSSEAQRNSLMSTDEGITWLSLEYRAKTNGFRFPGLNQGLYDGNSGIALFLSALYKITQDERWKNLTDRSLKTIQNNIRQLTKYPKIQERLVKKTGISGTRGICSIIYSLVKISELLQEPILLEDAHSLTGLITPDLIKKSSFSIIDGLASSILGLLALSKTELASASIKSHSLEIAKECGEYLLQYQQTDDKNIKTGFAHGLAGISYSFFRLFALTDDKRFLEAGKQALQQEQNFFSPIDKNWADNSSENAVFNVSWTNGASGIALSRLGISHIYNDNLIQEDINNALETTQKYCFGEVDNLCWGNFGRLETLLVASKKLNQPSLLEFSHQGVNSLLSRAESAGNFQLFSGLPPLIFNPSFHHGSSGIGYQLLRFAHPDLLPSILLWE